MQLRRQQRRQQSLSPARTDRSRSRSWPSRRASTLRGSSRERAAAGSISTLGSSREESAAVSIQGWYQRKKSITSRPTTTMSSTATNRYDILFSEVTPLKDDDIKQESSTLSEKDRGAKGSPEFIKRVRQQSLLLYKLWHRVALQLILRRRELFPQPTSRWCSSSVLKQLSKFRSSSPNMITTRQQRFQCLLTLTNLHQVDDGVTRP